MEDVELRNIISDLCNEQADYPTDFAIRDIKKVIQQEANRRVNKVLDRLETHYWLNDDIDTLMCPEIEAFVEAERNRLNPSKSTPFNKLKESNDG